MRTNSIGNSEDNQVTARILPAWLILIAFFWASCATGWAMTYPDPEAVAADFPDKKTRAAAFVVLLKTVNNNGLSKEAAAKYAKALDDLDPPWLPEHPQFTKELHAISDQPQFQYDIIKRYLPELAPRIAVRLQEQDRARKSGAFLDRAENVVALMLGVMFIVPLLFLAVPWGLKQEGPLIPDNVAGPFRLPDSLRRPRVFRRSYSVLFDCGQVLERKQESETYSTTTYTPGRQYTIGDTTYQEQGTHTTSYRTTVYDRFTFKTPDGRENWVRTVRGSFHAPRGHLISMLCHSGDLIAVHNHTVNSFGYFPEGLAGAHRFPGKWAWGATVLAVGLTMYLARNYVPVDPETGMTWDSAAIRSMILFAIISPIYILIVKWLVQLARNLEFRWRYRPQFKKFFEECTPALMERFPPLPNAADVRPA